MKRLGTYCKAFYVGRLREFAGWDSAGESAAPALRDEDLVYLQEDYTVTKNIFIDEEPVFGNAAPGWLEFCRDTLNFAPPARGPELTRGEER